MKTSHFIPALIIGLFFAGTVLLISSLFFSCADPVNPGNTLPATASFDAVMTSTSAQIRAFLSYGHGFTAAKLVFIKKVFNPVSGATGKELCYFDFSEAADTLRPHIIAAANGAQVPVISPDGNWVVYAVGAGAEAGSPIAQRSSVYICRLQENVQPVLVARDSACEPRFYMNSNKLTVIYTTLAPNLAWQGKGKTMKVDIDVSGGTPSVGTPSVVWGKGSYTGGISWDEKYLCGGGERVAMADIATGDTATIDIFAQACNASISSSRIFGKTMMYLTTQGQHPNIDNNKKWGTWQIIFIGNFDKKICKWYRYPDTSALKYPIQTTPEKSYIDSRWHHPEWSNHPYYACATYNVDRFFSDGKGGWINTFYQERIFLINLKANQYLEIVRPKNMGPNGKQNDDSGYYWPWLWVEVPAGFAEDQTWLNPIF